MIALNIFFIPIDFTERRSIDRFHGKSALKHAAFHLLYTTTGLLVVATLEVLRIRIVVIQMLSVEQSLS